MKKFYLADYANSNSSAPELIGDISTEYGKKQIHEIAKFNGLNETHVAADYANVIPFGVDHRLAVSLQYIQDILTEDGLAVTYITDCGEIYATKTDLEYKYLDNHVDDVLWDELESYGEEAS